MHLKTLTVRGFKSFASATTFEFEPGVTAVVGPNGSGKSNVVDALAWVMGEQGAKSLRGGSMEDVIFAGTTQRQPLGRASVSLTIDNSDGALPIDYAEVTISRTMFRSGGSEYTINGAKVRLLDIQELLSDSGLGREMHVIVGQGQLDQILHATPEQRRGFIEEAAGVLKHRRRRERAVRKLESMQGNLERLEDLIGEISRQLTPLGRQAKVARRAQRIQHDLRDALSRLIADDLVQAASALREWQQAEETEAEAAQTLQAELTQYDQQLGRHREAVQRQRQRQEAFIQGAHRLAQVQERLRSVASLARERAAGLTARAAEAESGSGADPELLRRQAEQRADQAVQCQNEVTQGEQALKGCEQERAQAEELLREEELRLTEALRAIADRRAGLATLKGQAEAAQQRQNAAEERCVRARVQEEAEQESSETTDSQRQELLEKLREAESSEAALQSRSEQAQQQVHTQREVHEQLLAEHRRLELNSSDLAARISALEAARDLHDGAAALEQEQASLLNGRLADRVQVEAGWEKAAAAILGSLDAALVTSDAQTAAEAAQWLSVTEAGRVHLVYPYQLPDQTLSAAEELPAGAIWAHSLICCPAEYSNQLSHALQGVVFVQEESLGQEVVAAGHAVTAVTAEGTVLRCGELIGGSAVENTVVTLTLQLSQLNEQLQAAQKDVGSAASAVAEAGESLNSYEATAQWTSNQLADQRAVRVAAEQQLAHLQNEVSRAQRRSAGLLAEIDEAEAAAASAREQTRQIQERVRAAQNQETTEEPSTDERDRLNEAASKARTAEMEARLTLRAAQQQHEQMLERAASLRRNAQAEEHRREQARNAAAKSLQGAKEAEKVRSEAEEAVIGLDSHIAEAEAAAIHAQGTLQELETELSRIQIQRSHDAERLQSSTESLHQAQLKQTELRVVMESAESRAEQELSLSAAYVIEHFGPDQLIPDAETNEPDDQGTEASAGSPYVRGEQEARLAQAKRELKALGKVNPLALEEHAALEERHRYLQGQLTDLTTSREDLLGIIHQVDATVERVFSEAWEDTRLQFERVFSRLFPGGEGRLELTNPEDMLGTGIEVHARPPGKRIKRLSLLSGGERSLTAVALLVAIFKARPSPFYVMDEVEAALDDTNLSRLLVIFDELRESSQLIVITHQKRTMEIADALYGVSMRQDGSTRVVSQRLREATD